MTGCYGNNPEDKYFENKLLNQEPDESYDENCVEYCCEHCGELTSKCLCEGYWGEYSEGVL